MVNQVIVLEGTVSAGDAISQVDSVSPASGETITISGYYTDGNTDTEYTVQLEEQTLIDEIPGEDAPTESEPHPLDLRLEQGDDLKFAVTEAGGNGQTVEVYLLATNTNLPQA
jgi:hypothetical protein